MTKKIIYFSILLFLLGFFQYVFSASDSVRSTITGQKTLGNREVHIGTGVTQIPIQYMNEGNNIDVTGNYFKGYYYDPIYGFFKLDWSSNKNENVHIKGGSNKCASGYGYRLRGSAQSETVGKIYFDYNNEYQVYYCLSDSKLHGKAYSPVLGKQDFEGVEFDIFTPNNQTNIITSRDDIFLNDSTIMFYSKADLTPIQESQMDEGVTKTFYKGKEKIFYVFKIKK